jgi:hypothetical protein
MGSMSQLPSVLDSCAVLTGSAELGSLSPSWKAWEDPPPRRCCLTCQVQSTRVTHIPVWFWLCVWPRAQGSVSSEAALTVPSSLNLRPPHPIPLTIVPGREEAFKDSS